MSVAWLWKKNKLPLGKLHLYELIKIVKQSVDLQFLQLLNRLRVLRSGDELDPIYIKKIQALEETDISNWTSNYIKLYLINYRTNEENELLLKLKILEEILKLEHGFILSILILLSVLQETLTKS